MKPRVKYGLSVGVAGLLLNACVSAAMGACGLVMSLLVGAIAGFLTGQAEKAPEPSHGARLGAISGLIAGGLVLRIVIVYAGQTSHWAMTQLPK